MVWLSAKSVMAAPLMWKASIIDRVFEG